MSGQGHGPGGENRHNGFISSAPHRSLGRTFVGNERRMVAAGIKHELRQQKLRQQHQQAMQLLPPKLPPLPAPAHLSLPPELAAQSSA